MCTRFATEVVLRRNIDHQTTHKVEIIPAPDLDEAEQKALQDWQPAGVNLNEGLTKQTMTEIVAQVGDILSNSCVSNL